jgi:hypothetical protein
MRGNVRAEDGTFRGGQVGHDGERENILAFHKDTAARTGRIERDVRRDADRGGKIAENVFAPRARGAAPSKQTFKLTPKPESRYRPPCRKLCDTPVMVGKEKAAEHLTAAAALLRVGERCLCNAATIGRFEVK